MSDSKTNERFIRLFASHEQRLCRDVAALMPVAADVDDVRQETAIAMMRKFDDCDSEQLFFHWACRFAFYEVLQQRKRNRHCGHLFSDEVVETLAQEFPEYQRLADQRRGTLAECLRKLEDQDR